VAGPNNPVVSGLGRRASPGKTARIAWAILARGGVYNPPATA
jgi:hypothetical protein